VKCFKHSASKLLREKNHSRTSSLKSRTIRTAPIGQQSTAVSNHRSDLLLEHSSTGTQESDQRGHQGQQSRDQLPPSSNQCDVTCNHDDVSLPFDPREWTRDDVTKWLNLMRRTHKIADLDLSRFVMNGKALCLMSVDMFERRVESRGVTLYEDFRRRLVEFVTSPAYNRDMCERTRQ